jgi:hypothetical protein
MKIALGVENEHTSYRALESDLENDAGFEITIKNLCGLFVIVVDNKVYLIHQTAKEFFRRTETGASLDHGWKSVHHVDRIRTCHCKSV